MEGNIEIYRQSIYKAGIVFLLVLLGFFLFPLIFYQKLERQYIVRYGTTEYVGDHMDLKTTDGIWSIEDPPEFEDGTAVRILFDSNNTKNPDDDKVIDVTEI